jgi:hypothetical protein
MSEYQDAGVAPAQRNGVICLAGQSLPLTPSTLSTPLAAL